MRSPRRATAVAMVVAVTATVAFAACSNTEPGAITDEPVPASLPASAVTSEQPRAATTASPSTMASAPSSIGDPAGVAVTAGEPIATIAEGVVPGIDSDDPFCRAWSEFAGTFQALVLVSIVGTDAGAAPGLEIVAAPAVIAASDSMSVSFPPEIAQERDEFVDGLLGPFTRRAERAREELGRAGLTDADAAELRSLWLVALGEAGIDDPNLTVAIPENLAGVVATAAAAFADRVPPIGEDPSLVTDAEAPATEAHIAANCPDQGTLGGNDVID